MTQTASSPRSHQLTVSGHAPAIRFPHPDLPVPGFAGAGPAARLEDAAPAVEPEPAPGDLLSAVWRTSSYVESVQWELDSAQESLLQAVRRAAMSGVAHDELCAAANLTPEELSDALLEAPAGPAALAI